MRIFIGQYYLGSSEKILPVKNLTGTTGRLEKISLPVGFQSSSGNTVLDILYIKDIIDIKEILDLVVLVEMIDLVDLVEIVEIVEIVEN